MQIAYNSIHNVYREDAMINLTGIKMEILSIIYTNPEREFYMHEIGRIIGKKPGNFQRAINNLVEDGFLESEYRANARYFKATKNHPFYEEVKKIVLKSSGIKERIRDSITKQPGIKVAFVYGSFAKGKEKAYSDIDIFLVGKVDESKIIKDLDIIEKKYGREINYRAISEKELFIAVKEKDSFMISVLSDKKEFLKGGEDELRNILVDYLIF